MDFSDEMMDEILKIFQVESEEIISKLNNSLLDLEKMPNNKDAVLMLFRDAHTLKGASRMVGFSNVQTIAHKMEDILGLAKDNKISLNSDVVNVLYKTVDFLSELIQKSIKKGQEIYTEDIAKHLEILENTANLADTVITINEEVDFNVELFNENTDEVNDLLVEVLFVLMKIETEKNGNLIGVLLSKTESLYNIFKITGPYNIKKPLEDIKVKLEVITRASNSLTTEEIEQIHQTFNILIDDLNSIYDIYNFELVDYYDLAFKKISETREIKLSEKPQQQVEIIVEELTTKNIRTKKIEEVKEIKKIEEIEEVKFCALDDLECIQNKISALIQNNSSISEIKNFLINFKKNYASNNIKNIFQIIIKIIDYAEINEIRLDEETISILQQSVEYCDNIMKNKSEIADKEMVLQRLEIILQVLELKNESENENNFVTTGKYKVKSEKNSNVSDIFNTGEIKTLRIDSSKLDALINQINELTVNKIKTKKYLYELNEVNKNLEEWQRNSTKLLSYLKHHDKKYFQSGSNDNSISFFIKQLLNLFSDNNKKVQEAILNVANLHRTIQEDDIKMNMSVENLENMVKNIRVLPLAMVFHLFGRMVRDIAQEKNKKIELKIIGSEIATDKKIIEEIKTPLIHIIRNAIDHGIETPEERTALGKNPTGTIILSAHQISNKIIIEIKDDGRGINLAKIREKALKKGFLTQEELNSMTDEQITNIIFAPGFSTGEEITNISGRGIGLDVVQTKISQLNGRVKVLSQTNKGCCVQIELPTTMSIVKAFLVKSSNQMFAVPMETIKTVLRRKKDEVIGGNNSQSIIFEDKKIPLYNLSDILNLQKFYSDGNEKTLTILIIENNDGMISFAVDKLMGDQEVLHKKLSAPFYKLKNISGITTLDSGEICFILNIPDILNTAAAFKSPLISSVQIKQKQQNNNYKILLVDDSITTRTLEKNILTKAGYKIEIAENPLEAFEKMKIERFDLIISDIEMPQMDGLTFLEKLKTDEMFSDIPVILLSSLVNEANKKRAIESGAEICINKNEFNQEYLQDIICKILEIK